MLRLFLVRHGETEWNKSLRLQGHTDVPLSDKGREQAKALQKRLAEIKIDAFYASDLIRAVETASIIAEPHQKSVIKLPEFRETKFGAWEGLTYDEIVKKYPKEIVDWQQRPSVTRIPEGENLQEVADRCMEGIARIKREHTDQSVLIAAHGGIIRIIIGSLIGIDLDDYWILKQDNVALNIIEIFDEKVILCLLNDTAHVQTNSCLLDKYFWK